MHEPQVTGEPRWKRASETVARIREMPAQQAEANIQSELHSMLRALFPGLPSPELTLERETGDGPTDIYCRNVIFETKKQNKLDARTKPDGTVETPEDQAVRYLNALTFQPNLFDERNVGWRACITDGKEWKFYDYDREASEQERLKLQNSLRLNDPTDDDALLSYLYDFVNRTVKLTPPTDNKEWVEKLSQKFRDIAEDVYSDGSPAYDIKRALWRDALRGAYITPPDEGGTERDLFARHTMLVVMARAVAETIMSASETPVSKDDLHEALTQGFAAWLLDAAGERGRDLLDEIIAEVSRYDWQAQSRDTLKDLYHAAIPRDIRHDFGEYYTPDWLARAVCEEVMDSEWRKEVIEMAVWGQLQGPVVLDPGCGSGTFLFHATQLLLEDARKHPALANSPQAQVEIVNGLVAGIDLHPVAVELAKTTKMLSFSDLAQYAKPEDDKEVYLGDSLQWETTRNRALFELGDLTTIPSDDPDDPLKLPRTFLLSENFLPRLRQIFDYANREVYPGIEDDLKAVLNLNTELEESAIVDFYRRMRQYREEGRNHVWQWYIANLMQPMRLSQNPMSRLVGNPPWVVYNAMSNDRQETFKEQAQARNIWAGAELATQNDLAATFVATCVDFYLKPGGKFGFVLPYAALRTGHWAGFRTGRWSLPENMGRQPTIANLSKDAWDFIEVNEPPFPQSHSSVVFGTRQAIRSSTEAKPLDNVLSVTNTESVNPKMAWQEVQSKLSFTPRRQVRTAPSEAYSKTFRNGATLFPQPLVVFEEADSRALGKVWFKTKKGTGNWNGKERQDSVGERFVKPALFSRLFLPFGVIRHSNIIAPLASDGRRLETALPQGDDASEFRRYWDKADYDWRRYSSPRPPLTLLDQIDYQGKLSSQLRARQATRVIYNSSGSYLSSAVVSSNLALSHTLYWTSCTIPRGNYYLSAIFNARCLQEFFRESCRRADRHFMLGPVQNLPIPRFAPYNMHHNYLAAQSKLAHQRVAALIAERQAKGLKTTRNNVMNDPAMQPILASIDATVRVILPEYCSTPG